VAFLVVTLGEVEGLGLVPGVAAEGVPQILRSPG
jgi:hypothetical protein